jgi:hypothetical protein
MSKPATEKLYHIYAKNRCIFHSVKEEEFSATWSTLKNMVGLMKTDYNVEDLTYEEVHVFRGNSESPSY